jgi:hypothetical protein
LLNENLAKEYDEQATGLLVDDATGLLDKSGETEALDENISIINRKPTSIIIQLVDEVMLVHTEEVI